MQTRAGTGRKWLGTQEGIRQGRLGPKHRQDIGRQEGMFKKCVIRQHTRQNQEGTYKVWSLRSLPKAMPPGEPIMRMVPPSPLRACNACLLCLPNSVLMPEGKACVETGGRRCYRQGSGK